MEEITFNKPLTLKEYKRLVKGTEESDSTSENSILKDKVLDVIAPSENDDRFTSISERPVNPLSYERTSSNSLPLPEANMVTHLGFWQDQNMNEDAFLDSSSNSNIFAEKSDKNRFPINLSDWKPKFLNAQLVIEGILDEEKRVSAHVVKRRIFSYIFSDEYGTVCSLIGTMAPNDSLPPVIKQKFLNGIPENWQYVCEYWKSLLQENLSEIPTQNPIRVRKANITMNYPQQSTSTPQNLNENYHDILNLSRINPLSSRKGISKRNFKNYSTVELRRIANTCMALANQKSGDTSNDDGSSCITMQRIDNLDNDNFKMINIANPRIKSKIANVAHLAHKNPQVYPKKSQIENIPEYFLENPQHINNLLPQKPERLSRLQCIASIPLEKPQRFSKISPQKHQRNETSCFQKQNIPNFPKSLTPSTNSNTPSKQNFKNLKLNQDFINVLKQQANPLNLLNNQSPASDDRLRMSTELKEPEYCTEMNSKSNATELVRNAISSEFDNNEIFIKPKHTIDLVSNENTLFSNNTLINNHSKHSESFKDLYCKMTKKYDFLSKDKSCKITSFHVSDLSLNFSNNTNSSKVIQEFSNKDLISNNALVNHNKTQKSKTKSSNIHETTNLSTNSKMKSTTIQDIPSISNNSKIKSTVENDMHNLKTKTATVNNRTNICSSSKGKITPTKKTCNSSNKSTVVKDNSKNSKTKSSMLPDILHNPKYLNIQDNYLESKRPPIIMEANSDCLDISKAKDKKINHTTSLKTTSMINKKKVTNSPMKTSQFMQSDSDSDDSLFINNIKHNCTRELPSTSLESKSNSDDQITNVAQKSVNNQQNTNNSNTKSNIDLDESNNSKRLTFNQITKYDEQKIIDATSLKTAVKINKVTNKELDSKSRSYESKLNSKDHITHVTQRSVNKSKTTKNRNNLDEKEKNIVYENAQIIVEDKKRSSIINKVPKERDVSTLNSTELNLTVRRSGRARCQQLPFWMGARLTIDAQSNISRELDLTNMKNNSKTTGLKKTKMTVVSNKIKSKKLPRNMCPKIVHSETEHIEIESPKKLISDSKNAHLSVVINKIKMKDSKPYINPKQVKPKILSNREHFDTMLNKTKAKLNRKTDRSTCSSSEKEKKSQKLASEKVNYPIIKNTDDSNNNSSEILLNSTTNRHSLSNKIAEKDQLQIVSPEKTSVNSINYSENPADKNFDRPIASTKSSTNSNAIKEKNHLSEHSNNESPERLIFSEKRFRSLLELNKTKKERQLRNSVSLDTENESNIKFVTPVKNKVKCTYQNSNEKTNIQYVCDSQTSRCSSLSLDEKDINIKVVGSQLRSNSRIETFQISNVVKSGTNLIWNNSLKQSNATQSDDSRRSNKILSSNKSNVQNKEADNSTTLNLQNKYTDSTCKNASIKSVETITNKEKDIEIFTDFATSSISTRNSVKNKEVNNSKLIKNSKNSTNYPVVNLPRMNLETLKAALKKKNNTNFVKQNSNIDISNTTKSPVSNRKTSTHKFIENQSNDSSIKTVPKQTSHRTSKRKLVAIESIEREKLKNGNKQTTGNKLRETQNCSNATINSESYISFNTTISQRGRSRVPKLPFWAGVRLSTVNNETIIQTPATNNQSICNSFNSTKNQKIKQNKKEVKTKSNNDSSIANANKSNDYLETINNKRTSTFEVAPKPFPLVLITDTTKILKHKENSRQLSTSDISIRSEKGMHSVRKLSRIKDKKRKSDQKGSCTGQSSTSESGSISDISIRSEKGMYSFRKSSRIKDKKRKSDQKEKSRYGLRNKGKIKQSKSSLPHSAQELIQIIKCKKPARNRSDSQGSQLSSASRRRKLFSQNSNDIDVILSPNAEKESQNFVIKIPHTPSKLHNWLEGASEVSAYTTLKKIKLF